MLPRPGRAEVRFSGSGSNTHFHLSLSSLSVSPGSPTTPSFTTRRGAGCEIIPDPGPRVSLCPAIPQSLQCCMTLVVAASLSSILQSYQETEMSGDKEFDKLELRNRTVTETLSPVEDLGQDKKVSKSLIVIKDKDDLILVIL